MTAYPCQRDGAAWSASVDPIGLTFPDRQIAWVDIDGVRFDGPNVVLDLADGSHVAISHLAREHDDFVLKLRDARNSARRAALLQWTGDAPIDHYDARVDGEPVRVMLFADGLTVEGFTGVPQMAPFALVDGVDRDGYALTIRLRSLPPVRFAQMGNRTDEFLADLDKARQALSLRAAEAYAALAPDLQGFTSTPGWALTKTEAGQWWAALRAAVAGTEATAEIGALESIAGDALRLGLAPLPGGAFFPFALAPANGKVAIEGTSAEESRATYVFKTDDVDRLNAVLVLMSFRREAIFFPDDQLGRWALAVRLLDIVRWARAALVARVVHDDNWEQNVRAALA